MKESMVRCNNCMEVFEESKIVYDGDMDMEFCPCCGEGGCLMDLDKVTKNYKEIRKISAYDLRQLCIDNNWYTAGDNEEYDHLLIDLADSKENLSTADIIEIADDIMQHSHMHPDYQITDVAFAVARIANTFFVEES